ncbi:ABC transporter substrate-binding protein [Williamsia sp. CHRR-6]|uniref:ABC transporter substrate-binding protein n=1 Tax=Williamsia sp. CHRR-6 TaxID=2835871 RepID=UPI001BDB3815|nr:ABC transporter substrate-binding protein [Williamsia sp. CHRR-6]MBT0566849.1 ABC transporter substrate-binding protein [Williamsia sp. CHRR-6]
MVRFRIAHALSAIGLLLLTGCGADVKSAAPSSGSVPPVQVSNCGLQFTSDRVPSRVVTNDTGITEMMFALGLRDKLIGYTTYDGGVRDIASSPWRGDFAATRTLGTSFTREVIAAARPDFVFAGWNYGFRESTGVTPDWVRSIGAQPYQLTEACRQPGGGTRRGIMRPFDALVADITNLGAIFRVPDRAAALVASFRKTLSESAKAQPEGAAPARVFVFDSADPAPFTAGRTATPDQIIADAGGSNIFDDLNDSWTTVSWEAAAQRDPQVIVIVDYGTGPANAVQTKKALLEQHPLMSRTAAVVNKRYVVLPYAAMVESPRYAESTATIARYLRSQGY